MYENNTWLLKENSQFHIIIMSEFKLSKVEKILNNDSKYIKPFRMHYNLVMTLY